MVGFRVKIWFKNFVLSFKFFSLVYVFELMLILLVECEIFNFKVECLCFNLGILFEVWCNGKNRRFKLDNYVNFFMFM